MKKPRYKTVNLAGKALRRFRKYATFCEIVEELLSEHRSYAQDQVKKGLTPVKDAKELVNMLQKANVGWSPCDILLGHCRATFRELARLGAKYLDPEIEEQLQKIVNKYWEECLVAAFNNAIVTSVEISKEETKRLDCFSSGIGEDGKKRFFKTVLGASNDVDPESYNEPRPMPAVRKLAIEWIKTCDADQWRTEALLAADKRYNKLISQDESEVCPDDDITVVTKDAIKVFNDGPFE